MKCLPSFWPPPALLILMLKVLKPSLLKTFFSHAKQILLPLFLTSFSCSLQSHYDLFPPLIPIFSFFPKPSFSLLFTLSYSSSSFFCPLHPPPYSSLDTIYFYLEGWRFYFYHSTIDSPFSPSPLPLLPSLFSPYLASTFVLLAWVAYGWFVPRELNKETPFSPFFQNLILSNYLSVSVLFCRNSSFNKYENWLSRKAWIELSFDRY